MRVLTSIALTGGTLVLAVTIGVLGAAAAPTPDPSTSTSSSTSTTAITLLPPIFTPKSSTTSSSSTTSTTKPGSPPPNSGDGPSTGPDTIPPDVQKVIDSVKRTPPSNTKALLTAIQPLVDQGLNPTDAAVLAFGQFPVAGLANYSDDWLEPRFSGGFHLHQGTDIFADAGVPIRAPFAGTARLDPNGLGGLAVTVTQTDGTYVYMAHMSAYAPIMTTAKQVPVNQGDVVGFVGNTGDAAGGPTHCHFELHPKGGAAVDPKSSLDAWLKAATTNVPKVIAAFKASKQPPPTTPPPAPPPPVRVPTGPDGEQLWAASLDPPIGALTVATELVDQAAAAVDWPAAPPPPAGPSPQALGG